MRKLSSGWMLSQKLQAQRDWIQNVNVPNVATCGQRETILRHNGKRIVRESARSAARENEEAPSFVLMMRNEHLRSERINNSQLKEACVCTNGPITSFNIDLP
mmetsp:Transcript_10110/g.37643  ORF Transcript_10110/g.37643 Transcript_10110/m.37643 type:complete len:103 (-) Transcript_10110:99-407(-)